MRYKRVILYSPQTPVPIYPFTFNKYIIFFFTVFLMLISSSSFGQIDSLESACFEYYQAKEKAEIEEYKQLRKYKLLRFLPSFGYSIERRDFIISLNSSLVVNFLENKQLRHNKIASIRMLNQLQYKQDLTKINLIKDQIHQVQKEKNIQLELFEIEKAIYSIKEKQYNKTDIDPIQFLEAKKKYIQQKKKITDIDYKLFLLNQELLITSKWST